MDSFYRGVPGADIIVTYDNHKLLEEIKDGTTNGITVRILVN